MSEPHLLFDRRFIDDGKDLCDLSFSQCAEGVLMENDAPAVDWNAPELIDRRAVEPKAGSNVTLVRHDEIGVETEVRDVSVVFFEHCPISVYAECADIVDDVSGNEV
jgi:hypothetical protein